MGRSKALILATLVAASASSAAFGADLLPPPPQLGPPPPMDVGGGWYLRGDVGVGAVQMSNWRSTLQPFDETGNAFNAVAVPSFAAMGDQTFGGVGVGYQFNHWLRADITGEYRTEATYRANIMSAWTLNNPTAFGTDSIHRRPQHRFVHGQRVCRSRHLVWRYALCRRGCWPSLA